MRLARSPMLQPRRCATPYSVTTASTSERAVVTTPPSSAALIVDCAARCGAQRDDRSLAGERGGPGEVDLPADGADIHAAADLGADLAAQVDLDGEVDRHQRAQLRKHLRGYGCSSSAGIWQAARATRLYSSAEPECGAGDNQPGVDLLAAPVTTPLSTSRNSPSVTMPV